MSKGGAKPQGKVKIKWSSEFAYAIGLLATDGSLSTAGRHMDLTSKDLEQIENFRRCLGLKVKVGRKARGGGKAKEHYRVQFGDVLFYKFLLGIGLTPAKSKTMGQLDIPSRYFLDFLRGSFDGDGTFYSYYDPRWRSSFMFYTEFISASKKHIDWLRLKLKRKLGIWGHITHDGRKITYQLKYAKRESVKVLQAMYYNENVVCLSRKRLKVEKALGIVGLSL